jgi:hypothetical protein
MHRLTFTKAEFPTLVQLLNKLKQGVEVAFEEEDYELLREVVPAKMTLSEED